MKNNPPLLKFLRDANLFCLDTLFPITCLGCRQDGNWLCDQCLADIPLRSFQLCPYCEKEITRNGWICERCRQRRLEKDEAPGLDALICATDYEKIARLVHMFKYDFIPDLGQPLGRLILRSLRKSDLPLPDYAIPVPIHLRRLKWRGFNQAEILARVIAEELVPGLEIPVRTDLIERRRATKSQMKIKAYQARLDNLCGAFASGRDVSGLKNKKILLVDDIATTGATLFECAKVLKSAGAGQVYATVIARQKI